MKRSLLLPLVACLFLAAAPEAAAQTQGRTASLLVVENEAINGVAEIQHLYRYNFRNGALASKDLVLTTKTLDVRFDLGENHIYRNRYVITEWGDVVDVREKKLLHQGDGLFVGVDGDRVIQHINKIGIEGYFFYDLETGRYARLEKPGKWALRGRLSPDQTKSALSGAMNNIWLHRLGDKEKLLGSGFNVRGEVYTSHSSSPPVFWLDDERILTQRDNGKVVILRLDGRVEPVVEFPVKGPFTSLPTFHRNRDGKIVYDCGCSSPSYIIDVERKTFRPYDWVALGHDFDGQNESDPSYGHVIRFRGREIGRLWGSVWRAATTEGYFAVAYGAAGSNLGYPKGMKVWSEEGGRWLTLDVPWFGSVIGWLEE